MPRGKPGVPVELREARLLAEYLAERYAGARIVMQPRLGAVIPRGTPDGLNAMELRQIGVWRRYPDAAVLGRDRVTIIEASLKPDPAKISIVQLYGRLFPQTAEFRPWWGLPLDLVLVWGLPDPACEVLARESGLRVEVYQPRWYLDWLQSLRPRDRRASEVTA